MNNDVHAAWGGNDVPGKMDHANLLEPAFSKSKDAISQRGHSHKGGARKITSLQGRNDGISG
ncbi:hypothetical protein [Collimonas arenae]|uniref:hypothetical protein n=1 Tax=Collimonas arenae TaxID=279058 RepID=UPI0012E01D78|nr:hypothetical protein [Collimonas arenae]